MSRLSCWLVLCVGSLAMLAVGAVEIDTATACAYFSGTGLFLHWLFSE